MRIIAPEAVFTEKPVYESYEHNEPWYFYPEFSGWKDSVTEQIDKKLAKLDYGPLPKLPGTELTEDEKLAQWLHRKKREHELLMEAVLGRPADEAEAEESKRKLAYFNGDSPNEG